MKSILGLVFMMVTAVACSSETGTMSPKAEPPPQPPQQFDTSDLVIRTFTLNSELNFFTADAEKVKVLEGTAWETDGVRYSFSFQNNSRIRPVGDASEVYCQVWVDTALTKRPEDIQFASQGLKFGTMSTAKKGEQISFALNFKGGPSQKLTLYCKNVRTAAEVNKHIGELISVR